MNTAAPNIRPIIRQLDEAAINRIAAGEVDDYFTQLRFMHVVLLCERERERERERDLNR